MNQRPVADTDLPCSKQPLTMAQDHHDLADELYTEEEHKQMNELVVMLNHPVNINAPRLGSHR